MCVLFDLIRCLSVQNNGIYNPLLYDMEVKRESGDLDLCREAMNAIKNADIPAPPSPEVYKVFQNGVLDFKP